MFDKLVESASTGAELKPRRRIFVVTFLFVAVMFATAVVASIYAANFDLGSDNFDIARLLTPIAETEPQPEPERIQPEPRNNQTSQSDRTTRVMNILRIEETPVVPTSISVERSPYLSRPVGAFELNPHGRDTSGPPATTPGGDHRNGSSIGGTQPVKVDETIDKEPPPAPVIETKKPITKSEGVINGKATHLPKPIYSAAAQAMRAQGTVNVQVTIDEKGNVVSARAVSGNPLLKVEAEKAAWKARFSPTYLSKVPVKVTGVIVYNFTR